MAGQSKTTREIVAKGCEPETVTVRHLATPAEQEAALVEMMASMGWRIERVGADEILVPTDPNHPEYAACKYRVERAKRGAA